jgi:hypothetical protein
MSYRENQWHEVPPGCCSLCEHGEHGFGHCKKCPPKSACNALTNPDPTIATALTIGAFYVAAALAHCANSPDARVDGAIGVLWAMGLFAVVGIAWVLIRAGAYAWNRPGAVARAIRAGKRDEARVHVRVADPCAAVGSAIEIEMAGQGQAQAHRHGV